METRPLTRAEAKALLKQADKPRDKALLVLGFNSGYRISELLSLRICDVFVDRGGDKWRVRDVITVPKEKMKGKKSARSIRLNSDAKRVLAQYGRFLRDNEMPFNAPLFTGRKSKTGKNKYRSLCRQSVSRILKGLAEKTLGTAEEISTHSMRKTFASHLYEATRDIYRVKAVLGHSFVATTELYLRRGAQIVDAGIDTLGLS